MRRVLAIIAATLLGVLPFTSALAGPLQSPIQPVLNSSMQGPFGGGVNSHIIWQYDSSGGRTSEQIHRYPLTNARATARTVTRDGSILTVASATPAFGDAGLSVEPAATNLFTTSKVGDGGWWTSTANKAAGIAFLDGVASNKIYDDSTAASAHTYGSPNLTLVDDTTYCYSVAVHAAEYSRVRMLVRTKAGDYVGGVFNLNTGTYASNNADGGGGVYLGGGWWRVWLYQDFGSGATAPLAYFYLVNNAGDYTYDGDGSSGVYATGAQIELGKVPTALIPTTTATVSRAADANVFTLPQSVKNILSTAEGTAVAEGALVARGFVPQFSTAEVAADTGIIASTTSLYSLLYYTSSGQLRSYDGTSSVNVAATIVAGTAYDVAVRWNSATNLYQVGYKLSSATSWTWGTAGAFDGAFAMATNLAPGYQGYYPFQIGTVTLFDKWLSDGEL